MAPRAVCLLILAAGLTQGVLALAAEGDVAADKFGGKLKECQISELQNADPGAGIGCVQACFSILTSAADEAVEFRRMTTATLWIGFALAVLCVGLLQPFVAARAGKKGWSGTNRLLVQLGMLVIGAIVGSGGGYALYSYLALPHGKEMYNRLMTLKEKNVIGTSFPADGSRQLTCNGDVLNRAETADNTAVASVRDYRGILQRSTTRIEDNAVRIELSTFGPIRDNMIDAMKSIDKIDPKIYPRTAPTPTDVGPIYDAREHTPFPSNFPEAGGLGALAGVFLGLGIHLARKPKA